MQTPNAHRDAHGILTHLPTGRRLGKRPPKRDPRNLRLNRYLTDKLAPPPDAIDHASLVLDWPMYGNNRYGSCGPAGLGHAIQSWSSYAQQPLTPPEQEIIDAYFAITGGQDTGVYLTEMYNWYRQHPISGDTLEAYVEINPNLTEMMLATQIFGSAGIGLSLPDGDQTFGPWIEVPSEPPNPYNGHYVIGVRYNRITGRLWVVTWGGVEEMSFAFFLKYCDEAYALANNLSLIQATMLTPEGFDWATLQYDLQHLGDPVEPPVEPPPGPGPGPSCRERIERLFAMGLWPSGVRV